MKNNISRAVLLVLASMQLGAFEQGATVEKQGKKVHVDKGLITRPDVSASPFYITELNLLFGSVLQRNVLLLLPDETASLGCVSSVR